ncbi:MAG: hypothetical protein ACLPT4_07445 [Verrucomicrobiia bacterium]
MSGAEIVSLLANIATVLLAVPAALSFLKKNPFFTMALTRHIKKT